MRIFTKEQSGVWGMNWFVQSWEEIRKPRWFFFGRPILVGIKAHITGHLPWPVKPGDRFLVPCISGETRPYTVVKVERPGDPLDMFFAECRWYPQYRKGE